MRPIANRVLAAALLAMAGAAAAQQRPAIPESAYRQGQPEVLQPETDPNEGPIYDQATFRAAYAKAQQPTVAVLWNREFSDMLEQGSSSSLTINQVQAGVVAGQAVGGPGYRAGQAAGVSAGTTKIDVQENRTQQAARRAPIERTDLQMRAAFLQTVSVAGVRMVDRNVVMRTTASSRREKDKDEKLDAQMIETAALSKHATLLMEVLNTPDPASPTGWSTYVSVKRLADGVVVMEGYFNGRRQRGAPSNTPRYEADPRGGFRPVAPKVTDVGRLVAEQMLARFGEALAAR